MNQIEFEEAFELYLKEQGPNPGGGFFGKWAWYEAKKDEFRRELSEKGIVLTD